MEPAVPEPPRKRRRPPSACVQCRRRKIRCDQNAPCDQCIKAKCDACTYVPVDHPASERKQPHLEVDRATTSPYEENLAYAQARDTTSTFDLRPTLAKGTETVAQDRATDSLISPGLGIAVSNHVLSERLRQLEQKLAEVTSADPNHYMAALSPTSSTGLKGTYNKTRLFGQSHWMYTSQQFPNILNLQHAVESGKHGDISLLFEKCKKLGRNIKAQHSWYQSIAPDFRDYIPPKQTSDNLLSAYFRTFESIYRVLHIPTFQREYELYWQNPQAANTGFVIRLLLVLAIGNCFSQDPVSPSSHQNSALQWIYTAQSWLCFPFAEKSRVSITGIQIHCLLLIARETNAVGGDLIWVSAGSLLRTAMIMGLHRDPAQIPGMSIFQVEMRRRLWATIMEISLQSCMNAGGSPLISTLDYDCQPPSNINDVQMDEENKSTPIPKPLNVYTQTTLQISLWRTLPLRLKIAKLVNDFRCEPSYDETIRLGMELSKLCRTISLQFQCFGTSQASPTIFQSKLFDFLNYRFLLILHHNYAVEARSNPSFYFSRKVCLETSLALLSAFSLSQRKNGTTKTEDETDLYRLKLVGGGLFRSVPLHAFLMTSLELMSQLQENPLNYTSVGDTMARQELYKTIEEFTELTAERIKAGETNVKGHVFSSCILAQINAAQTGAPVDQTMLNVLRKSLQSSYDFLKARVGGSPSPPSSSSSLETNSTNTNTNTTNVTNDPQGQKPALQQPMLKMPNEMWSQFDDVLGWNDMDNGFNLDFTESLY